MKLLKPSRRLFIAQALAAPALITSPRLVEAFWQSRDSNYNKSVGSAPPSGSGWGDHGTEINISTTTITNDTITSNSNIGFSSARGATSRSNADKVYFEIKILTAPAADATHMGLLNADTANGAAMDAFAIPTGISNYFNNGNTNTNGSNVVGTNLGAGVTTVANDIIGIAYDGPNGFQYLAQNNNYFLGGDPTSGATGTGHVGAYTGAFTLYPWATLWQVTGGALQLITGAGSLLYLPSGYIAWG